MSEIGFVLRDQPLQKTKHIAFYIGIGVLIYGQSAGGVLGVYVTDPVQFFTIRNRPLNVAGNVYHLFAMCRADGDRIHMLKASLITIVPQSASLIRSPFESVGT